MTTHENIQEDIQDKPFDGIQENRENGPPIYFNILYYGLIIWAVLFMAYYLLSGWSSHAEFQAKMKAHQEQAAAAMNRGPQQ